LVKAGQDLGPTGGEKGLTRYERWEFSLNDLAGFLLRLD
jgi:hypothetical protein